MTIKVLLVATAIISSCTTYAKCFEESKDLDSCLQCCTDTTQTAELARQYPSFVSDVSTACKAKTGTNRVDLASKSAKGLYAKYKIDGSMINLICSDGKLQDPNMISYEAYDECIAKCKETFPENKETKRKR